MFHLFKLSETTKKGFLILVAFTTANTSLCRYGKQRISELR